jgi:hypothetical protein
VAQTVIDGFEVVEVDEERRQGLPAAAGRKFAETRFQAGTVRQPGQDVVEGQPLELPLHLGTPCVRFLGGTQR